MLAFDTNLAGCPWRVAIIVENQRAAHGIKVRASVRRERPRLEIEVVVAGLEQLGEVVIASFGRVRQVIAYHADGTAGRASLPSVWRLLRIMKRNNFQGVLIPDNAPAMTCAAPWHAGWLTRALDASCFADRGRCEKMITMRSTGIHLWKSGRLALAACGFVEQLASSETVSVRAGRVFVEGLRVRLRLRL